MHITRTSVALALALSLAACGGKDDAAATADTGAGAASTVPSTTAPVATALRVTDVKLGRSVGADNRVADGTNDFKPNDTIYAVVETDGASSAGQSLVARWTFQDGQLVEEQTQAVNSAGGAAVTQFRINKPSGWPVGKYKVSIMMNGSEVESEEFEVKK
jgi:major membrane immunogen (membrane-anchored lipoprotein)